jgi:3-oxoadipate enol-lactonase
MSELTFATINGVILQYTFDGLPAGVPLVFLNSLGTDLRIWDKLISHLAGRYRLIRYDLRGHGLSDCPPGPYTIRDHTDDLAGLLGCLQVDEVILIGVSVGGMIAIDYAASRPQQVKALVLCDTAAKIGTAAMWNERIDSLRKNGMAYLADAILERWFSSAFIKNHPANYRGYFNMLTRMPVEGYTATCEAIRDADLREAVQTLSAKSLVLCGAEDGATPPELVRGLAEVIPKARFELIEEAGHIPSLEQPAMLAAKIDQFLSENGYV